MCECGNVVNDRAIRPQCPPYTHGRRGGADQVMMPWGRGFTVTCISARFCQRVAVRLLELQRTTKQASRRKHPLPHQLAPTPPLPRPELRNAHGGGGTVRAKKKGAQRTGHRQHSLSDVALRAPRLAASLPSHFHPREQQEIKAKRRIPHFRVIGCRHLANGSCCRSKRTPQSYLCHHRQMCHQN